jgi:hypothetical protein
MSLGHPWLTEEIMDKYREIALQSKTSYELSVKIGATRWKADVIWNEARNSAPSKEFEVKPRKQPGGEKSPQPKRKAPKPSPAKAGERWLVMGDAHVKPGQDLWRMHAAVEVANKYDVDLFLIMGDFNDMESLCRFEHGQVSAEGKRYTSDVDASRKAVEILSSGLAGRKTVILEGNHENWIEQTAFKIPHLFGSIRLEDLGYHEAGWDVVPFTEIWSRNGVSASHYFTSGAKGQPIGGVSPARAVVTKKHASCLFGHDHRLSYHMESLPNGRKLQGLGTGGFFEHNMSYAKQSNNDWWTGLCVLSNVGDGMFDLATISVDSLKGGKF